MQKPGNDFFSYLPIAERSGNFSGNKFTGTIIVDDIEKMEPEDTR